MDKHVVVVVVVCWKACLELMFCLRYNMFEIDVWKSVDDITWKELVKNWITQVLSHCFANFKYMRCKYRAEIMEFIDKDDPIAKKEEVVEEEEDEAVAVDEEQEV